MIYGIKISKPGYDVKTADLKDLVLSSEKNLFKIKNTANFSLVVSGGTGQTIINHNLGYAPTVLVYMETKPGNGQRSRLCFERDGTQAYACVTPTQLIIFPGSVYSDGTYNGRYYIFHDPIE